MPNTNPLSLGQINLTENNEVNQNIQNEGEYDVIATKPEVAPDGHVGIDNPYYAAMKAEESVNYENNKLKYSPEKESKKPGNVYQRFE